jgi:hypothetical protein
MTHLLVILKRYYRVFGPTDNMVLLRHFAMRFRRLINLLQKAAFTGIVWWKYFVWEVEVVDCLEWNGGVLENTASHSGKTFLSVS